MDLTPYIAALREDLATAASAGDEQTRRTAAVLSAALEPAARLAIMNALSDLAAQVTAAQDEHVVEVRLRGRDVEVVTSPVHAPRPRPEPKATPEPEPSAEAEEEPEEPKDETPLKSAFDDATGNISRVTLRMVDEIKSKAEKAAASQGVSLNSWMGYAVRSALQNRANNQQKARREQEQPETGERIRGWVRG
ncbi:toxin-antitoxin system HicB family antitoxin [Allokutzneria sp. A3M-2-11 16]|uniref:toxin-antitoxin system HicB family antitoxin n=1 Tax=Allokutzneria sp. A3M-2-11 16 TaxID=2962043 RepID=UPI0020B6B1D1|nr:toxin-antitoxin system HicB family antitoxin [Allokutzneria sp. A3M-2-11 16]MCP3797822.1 toxin-antitoxin system HicB family antitoxin [Allokutzneria sp. A3M-2-11 16]